jgi:hypothetical protein
MRINLPDISNSSRVTQLLLAPNADQMMELVIGLGGKEVGLHQDIVGKY